MGGYLRRSLVLGLVCVCLLAVAASGVFAAIHCQCPICNGDTCACVATGCSCGCGSCGTHQAGGDCNQQAACHSIACGCGCTTCPSHQCSTKAACEPNCAPKTYCSHNAPTVYTPCGGAKVCKTDGCGAGEGNCTCGPYDCKASHRGSCDVRQYPCACWNCSFSSCDCTVAGECKYKGCVCTNCSFDSCRCSTAGACGSPTCVASTCSDCDFATCPCGAPGDCSSGGCVAPVCTDCTSWYSCPCESIGGCSSGSCVACSDCDFVSCPCQSSGNCGSASCVPIQCTANCDYATCICITPGDCSESSCN